MTSRTGPFAAPHRGKGKGDGGKGVAATAATAAEYPSENEFLQAVSMCHGIRDRFEAAEEFHFPWFAVLAYKYVNAHRDFLYLTRGTPEGTDNTETLHSVFFAYGIQSTAMPVDMSKLRIAQDIADRVDVNRETDRQRIPREICVPYARYDMDWTFGSPYITEDTDLVWSPCHANSDYDELAPWQRHLQRMCKIDARLLQHGESPVILCHCSEAHYNFSKGFWICRRCTGDMGWRHEEPPCCHDGESLLCSSCWSELAAVGRLIPLID